MVKKVAMKHGHAADHRICEIHYHVNRTTIKNVRGINPLRVRQFYSILCVNQKVYLMKMHGLQLSRLVHDAPVLVCVHYALGHSGRIRTEALTVALEAFSVL